jgi:UDP:flavonoid glycosyltransferase YjiC (YdhE family)
MPQRPRAADADADADDDDEEEAVITFPDVRGGVHSFPWRRMPITYWLHKVGDEPSEMIRQIYLWSLLDTECVVLNSFAALEPTYLDHCRRSPLVPRPRVLAVGPLSEARATISGNRGGKPAVAPSEVAAWLDAFADRSVVYVSFGTQHALSPEQAACVADALARSSAAFVWAAGALTVLPEGFEAATASRGMVIRGWAPQVEILSHRAVGWFLMHCGMNAVLEAASAGVAMLTWPMGADHFFNKIVVEEAGVAMHVAEGADTVPDAGRMAEAIAAAVGDQGKAVRERAVELGRKAAAVVAEGGSSYVDFQELVHMLAKVD